MQAKAMEGATLTGLPVDPVLTLEEAAAYTKYAPKTLRNKRHLYPWLREGFHGTRKVLFRKSQLDRLLAGESQRARA